MTYTLYGCRRSGSLAVELVLAEIGLEYEIVEIDLNLEAQRNSDYRKINPQRKLPTLITPAGETLTESAAILLTLDERHPESRLMPAIGSIDRAKALRTLLFVATELYPIVEINDYPQRFSPDEDSSYRVREIARNLWRNRWTIVEREIAGNPYFLKSGFCLTDIYIAVVSRWAQQEKWRPENIPKIEKLTANVASRPKTSVIWSRHMPDNTPARFQQNNEQAGD